MRVRGEYGGWVWFKDFFFTIKVPGRRSFWARIYQADAGRVWYRGVLNIYTISNPYPGTAVDLGWPNWKRRLLIFFPKMGTGKFHAGFRIIKQEVEHGIATTE